MSNKRITADMIEKWIGSDNLGVDDFLGLLEELINEDYPIQLFKKEVLEFNEENSDA